MVISYDTIPSSMPVTSTEAPSGKESPSVAVIEASKMAMASSSSAAVIVSPVALT